MKANASGACIALILFLAGSARAENRAPAAPVYILSASTHALIYAQTNTPAGYVEVLTTQVGAAFEQMTGARPGRGVVLVVSATGPHPVLAAADRIDGLALSPAEQREWSRVREGIAKAKKELAGKSLTLEEASRLVPVPVPRAALPFLGLDIDAASLGTNAWVLCVPSPEIIREFTASRLPVLLKAELGRIKYLLLRPFLGKLQRRVVKGLGDAPKVVLFHMWMSRAEGIGDEEKKALGREYAKKFFGRKDREKLEARKAGRGSRPRGPRKR